MSRVGKIVVASGLLLASLALPPVAYATVLYDQTATPGKLTTYSMDYVAPNDVTAADDFTIPAGQRWTITEVDVLGEGGSFKTHVRVYSNAGGLPGAVLFDEDGITPTNKGTDFNSRSPRLPPSGPEPTGSPLPPPPSGAGATAPRHLVTPPSGRTPAENSASDLKKAARKPGR